MSTKQPRFISEEDELEKFPMTDKQFTAGGGIIWTPRELSDTDIENEIQRITYRLSHKTAKEKKGDRIELSALMDEELRRKIRRNGGFDPEIGKEFSMAKAKQALEKVEQVDASKEELVVEIRSKSGAIWGRTTLKPRCFSTGSSGYFASDSYRDPSDFSKFQFACNLVKANSKPST